MIRRFALAVVAATAIVLLPATAQAVIYPPPGTEMTISSPTVTVGDPFTVEISGPAGVIATLRITFPDSVSPGDVLIAGVKEDSKNIPGSGVASFTVTLNEPGRYFLSALVDGVLVDTQTVVARAKGGHGGSGGGDRYEDDRGDRADAGAGVDAVTGAGTGGGSAAGGSAAGASNQGLGDTGVDVLPIALGAAGLIALGGVAVAVSRRRQREDVDA